DAHPRYFSCCPLSGGISQINEGPHFIDLEFAGKSANNLPMKATTAANCDVRIAVPLRKSPVPLWLKLAYTAFMPVLVPVYLSNYVATHLMLKHFLIRGAPVDP